MNSSSQLVVNVPWAGGTTAAAGSSGDIQFNNGSNAFTASANLNYASDTLTVQDNVIIKGNGTSVAGNIKLNCYANSHYVQIVGPDHIDGVSYSLTLPNTITTVSPHATGGRILESNSAGTLKWIDTPTAAGGTLTSVGLAMPPAFSVTNSPLTGSGGTLTVGVTGGSSGQFLAYNGQWDTPTVAGLSSWIVDVNTGGDQTINSASNTLEIFGGTGITTGVGVTTEKNVTITLDNTAVSAGTYGDASNVAQITVDAQGRITNATNVAISASGGGFPSAVTAQTLAALNPAAVDTLYTVTTSSTYPDIIVTLPTAASNSGKIIGVKYAAQNSVDDTVLIKTISSQTIDGTNRTTNGLPLASVYTYYELISDGSNWWIK
jgi:hypothetical protein